MARSKQLNWGGRTIELTDRSIAELEEPVDALVSSDDTWLSHGGGVSRALWRAAGPEVARDASHRTAELELGSLYVGPAGKLRATQLVHAITVDLDLDRRARPAELYTLYASILRTAAQRGWSTIAWPLLGAGAGGSSPRQSIEAAATALRYNPDALPSRVVICALGPDFATCVEALERMTPAARVDTAMAGGLVGALANAAVAGAVVTPLAIPDVVGVMGGWLFGRNRPRPPSVDLPREFDVAVSELLSIALRATNRAPRAAELSMDEPHLRRGAEGWELAPEASRLGLLRRFELASSLLDAIGRPLPANLRKLCVRGLEARDGLVHGCVDDEKEQAVAHAILELRTWLAHAEAASLDTAPSLVRARLAEPAESAPIPPASKRRTRPAPAVVPAAVSHGTKHVLALRKFLLAELPPETRADLIQRARQTGHVGGDDDVLLELCVKTEDLATWLSEELSTAGLRRALTRLGLEVAPSANGRELALRVLEVLEFPTREPPFGLLALESALRADLAASTNASAARISQFVVARARDLERTFKIYVRFLVRWLYQEPDIDSLLVDKKWIKSGERLQSLSLGTLAFIIGCIEAELGKDDGFAPLRSVLGGRALLPKSTSRLIELRNLFVHDKRDATGLEKLPAKELTPRGLEFLREALALVEHLRAPDNRTFPFVIRVERITIDHYGRRTITAVSDGEPERPDETLFTEEPLRPGMMYLMRPLTNPWRVNPVLVALGDAVELRPEEP